MLFRSLEKEESLADMRKVVERERKYLTKELSGIVKKVFSSDANYLLFYDGRDWYGSLLREKILIRDCSDYEGLGKGYYRIAVRRHRDNKMLVSKMKEIIGHERD